MWDVKYDPSTQRFVMFGLGNQHVQGTYLTVRTSKDGITWSDPTIVIPAGRMPAFAHNVGVSGTATGDLDRNFVMVAYGAPYDLDSYYDNDCKVSGAPHSRTAGDIGISTDSSYGLFRDCALTIAPGQSFEVSSIAFLHLDLVSTIA